MTHSANPILARELSHIIGSIRLGSPEEERWREIFALHERELEEFEQLPEIRPSVMEHVTELLKEAEEYSWEWWRVCYFLAFELDGHSTHGDSVSALTELPAWQIATAETRTRILEAAKKYVLEQEPETAQWINEEIRYRPALAGYKALRLLYEEAPDFIPTLTAEVWRKWASIIVAYPEFDMQQNRQIQKQLVSLAYPFAPDEIISTVLARIDWENRGSNYISINRSIEHSWDDRMKDAVLAKCQESHLKPDFMGELLDDLLAHKHSEAKQWAETLVSDYPYANKDTSNKAVIAACKLMIRADDAGWPAIWPVMQRDTAFGQALVAMLASPRGQGAGLGNRLKESEIVLLYRWLDEHYPDSSNPNIFSDIGLLRSELFNRLIQKGTYAACEEISRLADEYPEREWLRRCLQVAHELASRNVWSPPNPSDILTLTRNRQSRLVRNASELMEVVLEALVQMQQELHGETPEIRHLWNNVSPSPKPKEHLFRPVSENEFSDEVKAFLSKALKCQGIVIRREDEIRPTQGEAQGEVTDIYISAVTKDKRENDYDSVTVIVETKGCWNRELQTAMESQLLGRYLNNNNVCSHGIYLVGWFNCEQWNDPTDGRKRAAPKWTKETAQDFFDKQAARVSQNGKHIKAFVMDAALRPPTPKPSRKSDTVE